MNDGTHRYARQVLLPEVGASGQSKISAASALIIGCGALGSAMAELMARAGIGALTLADRDFVEKSNLQRQLLFDEADAADRLPKAVAAANKLSKINSEISIKGVTADITPLNIEAHVSKVSMVLDGTDNVETRYLINDACVRLKIPWIYGGAVGTTGMVMAVVPGKGPCLRCLVPDAPPPGTLPTCDTAGIVGTAPVIVAALQVTEALKIIVGDQTTAGRLTRFDLWKSRFHTARPERSADCPCCQEGRFDFLESRSTSWTTTLCGRDAVQISPQTSHAPDLGALKAALSKVTRVKDNGFLLTFEVAGRDITLFPDGRAIIKGTTDESVARSLYAEYIGG